VLLPSPQNGAAVYSANRSGVFAPGPGRGHRALYRTGLADSADPGRLAKNVQKYVQVLQPSVANKKHPQASAEGCFFIVFIVWDLEKY
jgi:hypothetical protein